MQTCPPGKQLSREAGRGFSPVSGGHQHKTASVRVEHLCTRGKIYERLRPMGVAARDEWHLSTQQEAGKLFIPHQSALGQSRGLVEDEEIEHRLVVREDLDARKVLFFGSTVRASGVPDDPAEPSYREPAQLDHVEVEKIATSLGAECRLLLWLAESVVVAGRTDDCHEALSEGFPHRADVTGFAATSHRWSTVEISGQHDPDTRGRRQLTTFTEEREFFC